MDLSQYKYVYNAAAYFAGVEKYPNGLMEQLLKPGNDGFSALCWAMAEMSTQGELIRRDMGHDKREPLSEEKLRLHMTPRNISEARTIVMTAIAKGLGKGGEDEEDEEVDEVMAEIQKKTESD